MKPSSSPTWRVNGLCATLENRSSFGSIPGGRIRPIWLRRPSPITSARGADFRTPNFQSDLAHRPPHHRAYRDEWLKLGLDDAGWRLLAQRSLEQAALVETALTGVLGAIEAADVADQTIVVACADHGDAVASNGGVANKGGLLVEETVKIPLLISGPGISAGHIVDNVVTNLDIAPSLLRAAGLTPPDDLHGTDLMPLITRGKPSGRDGVMLQHYGLHQPIMQRAWRTSRWKLVVQEDGFCELYDMERDPHEMTNLASDPAHAETLASTERALIREMTCLGDDGARQRRLMRAIGSA